MLLVLIGYCQWHMIKLSQEYTNVYTKYKLNVTEIHEYNKNLKKKSGWTQIVISE